MSSGLPHIGSAEPLLVIVLPVLAKDYSFLLRLWVAFNGSTRERERPRTMGGLAKQSPGSYKYFVMPDLAAETQLCPAMFSDTPGCNCFHCQRVKETLGFEPFRMQVPIS